MEYECKLVPLSRMIVTENGAFKTPLCDSCLSADCSNMLEKKDISFFGVTSEHKVICKGDLLYFVVNCQGYISPKE